MFETIADTKTIPTHLRPNINLEVPGGEKKVLIHSCCAPCAGELMELMVENGIELTIYFYNPNIHPKKEYEIRKDENIRFAEKLGIPFVDADYDVQNWFYKAKGMEQEPERGVRCTMCFDMRFVKTAEYAKNNGFKVITSSLGISRWKNMEQINGCGHQAAGLFEGVTYWDYNWRKQGGGARMYEIAKRENFYKQEYCGCIYSLRDTNEWRETNSRDKIKIGEEFYAEKIGEVVSE
jgi:predicted adenine nucleotide alpha hydrolase (AANH) superfamily ATPase